MNTGQQRDRQRNIGDEFDDREDRGTGGAGEGDEGAGGKPQFDIEATARRMGWRPKKEWGGADPRKWVPADVFVERAFEKASALTKERYMKLDAQAGKSAEEVAQLRALLAEMSQRQTETSELIGSMHKQTVEVGKRARERALQDWEERHQQAVLDADPGAAAKAMSEIRRLEKEGAVEAAAPPARKPAGEEGDDDAAPAARKPGGQQQQQQVAPQIEEFAKRNKWFTTDSAMNAIAVGVSAKIERDNPGISMEDNLQLVEEQLAREYPDYFTGRKDVFDRIEAKKADDGEGDDGDDDQRGEGDEDDEGADPQPPRRPQRGQERDRRDDPPRVASPRNSAAGDRGRRRGERRFSDLPEEAQATYRKIKPELEALGRKTDPKYEYTQADYMADYQWD